MARKKRIGGNSGLTDLKICQSIHIRYLNDDLNKQIVQIIGRQSGKCENWQDIWSYEGIILGIIIIF